MNSKFYKWCVVPQCKSTSISTPNKLFVYVPNKKLVRNEWLTLARRDPRDVVTNSSIYFCEDHFDLPSDMENYMEYRIMGSVSQVRMKPGCIPKLFTCQLDRQTPTSNTVERQYLSKKRKIKLEECDQQLEQSGMATKHLKDEIASDSSDIDNVYGDFLELVSTQMKIENDDSFDEEPIEAKQLKPTDSKLVAIIERKTTATEKLTKANMALVKATDQLTNALCQLAGAISRKAENPSPVRNRH